MYEVAYNNADIHYFIAYLHYIVYISIVNKEHLKQRRERLGITQVEFAKTLGVTATTISRYETGLVEIPKWMDLVLEALEARQIKELQSQIQS